MIVSHESSATGAPVVALDMAKRLNERYNVMTVVLRKGKLHNAFVQASFKHVNEPNKFGLNSVKAILQNLLKDYGIHAVIINSVESSDILYGAAWLGLPTVSLLHEYADYTRPVGKISRALFTTDIAIYPAASLKESGLRELRETASIKTPLNHIWIRPQGSMRFNAALQSAGKKEWSLRKQLNIPHSAIVLAGAGHVQPRKGVDWFLETAYHLMKRIRAENDKRADDIHFVWLGDGFSENDINVSVWLETFMQRTGMKARCHFPGHVDSVSAALCEANVFLLTSRLDPFPNVAIDALESDCGIACFEGASGIADFVREHAARAVVAPYGDCPALAELILDKLEWLTSRDGTNSRISRERLDFSHYVEVIEQALEEARRRQEDISEVIERCSEFTSRFDADFYGKRTLDIGPFAGDSRRDFLALLQKGIVLAKPYPGSDIHGLDNERNHAGSPPFIEYVRDLMANDKTDCVIIDGSPMQRFTGRIALQFHVYYNDLIPEYAAWFRELGEHSVDLYVSHVHKLSKSDKAWLHDAVSGSVHFERTENFGRDVYPFHLAYLKSIQGHYDVVGHFHTKKSRDCGGDMGARWRKYLLQNLIGSVPAATQILDLFSNPRVGLVYADDRHAMDEGENKPHIEQLLGKMDIEPQGNFFSFPLGTMFWARVDALASLASLDKAVFRIPEPVPYDGSVLHAFERIIPYLARHAGYEAVKVYTKGTAW
jgi:glycosyltransferase involved in cell wall biosynthesis